MARRFTESRKMHYLMSTIIPIKVSMLVPVICVFVNRKFPHILIENSPTNSQKKHVYSCSSNHFLVSFKR